VFELFRNPNIDFMGKRHVWLGLSATMMLAAIIAIPVFGIKRGIELGGGSEVQVKYASTPDIGAIRSSLESAGLASVVNSIGAPEDHEVYIRVGLDSAAETDKAAVEAEITPRVVEALRTDEMRQQNAAGRVDVNTANAPALADLFESRAGMTPDEAERAAAALVASRKERGLFPSVDAAISSAGLASPAADALHQQGYAGPFVVRSQSYIGPAIGKELVQKAVWAVLGSLAGMLVYIWIRFQFRWGLAACVALVHDTVITFGLFVACGFEISLPVVASFLTLIGYSVNDKVVVFDRMRENLRDHGGSMDLMKLLNDSMNQALSRTVLTSVLTWLAAIALFLLGGPALRDFSFPLIVGIVVGTYSSMYTAAPFLLIWQRFMGPEKKTAAAAAEPEQRPARVAKKVRAQKGASGGGQSR
jgi:preprotein translocase subunit SecF